MEGRGENGGLVGEGVGAGRGLGGEGSSRWSLLKIYKTILAKGGGGGGRKGGALGGALGGAGRIAPEGVCLSPLKSYKMVFSEGGTWRGGAGNRGLEGGGEGVG